MDVTGIVKKTVETLTGTNVSGDEALVDAGIDSLSAVELVSTLGHELNTEIEPTVLFDHPTIGSLCDYLVAQVNASSETNTGRTAPVESHDKTSGLYTRDSRRQMKSPFH